MKSSAVVTSQLATAQQYNDLRQDALLASYLWVTANTPIDWEVTLEWGNYQNSAWNVVAIVDTAVIGITFPTVATESWYVLVSLNDAGTVVLTYWASDVAPTKPAIPADNFPCGYLLLAQWGTTIAQTDISDAKVIGSTIVVNMNGSNVVYTTTTQTLTNKTLTSPVINTPTWIVKSDVWLSNVNNTSDSTKNSANVTLTNKTVNLTDNTLSWTKAQFNIAVSDWDIVYEGDNITWSAASLTTPRAINWVNFDWTADIELAINSTAKYYTFWETIWLGIAVSLNNATWKVEKWGTNFVGITQTAGILDDSVLVNDSSDNNQSGLTEWVSYWYNTTTWVIESWVWFMAKSTTDIVFDISYIEKNSIYWNWSDWVLVITNWQTINLNTEQLYQYSKIDIQTGWTLSTLSTSWILKIKCNWIVNINWNINLAKFPLWNLASTSFTSVLINWQTVTTWTSWTAWDWGTGRGYATIDIPWVWLNWYWGWGMAWAWKDNSSNYTLGWSGWDGGTPWGLGWDWTTSNWLDWGTSAWGWGWGWPNDSALGWDWGDSYWQSWSNANLNWQTITTAWWGWGAWWDIWKDWGWLILYTHKLTWSWSISCNWINWGNWGNGWDWALHDVQRDYWGWGWGWGWGAWGCWWFIFLCYDLSTYSWTKLVTKGLGWIWGTWWITANWAESPWNWSNWVSGVGWTDGQLIELNYTNLL